jgi:hypothetical protein
MKNSLLLLAAAALAPAFTAVPSHAQATATPAASAAAQLQQLSQALAGKWKLEVRFEADSASGTKAMEGTGEESWSAGPGGITLIEQEHIPSPQGDVFLMGLIWWDSSRNQLGGMECNSYLPVTCDLKGGLNDIALSWDGGKFQIDEQEIHNGRHTVWHEYWTDITRTSFTQTGDVTHPDGTTTRFLTIHGTRAHRLTSIGAE